MKNDFEKKQQNLPNSSRSRALIFLARVVNELDSKFAQLSAIPIAAQRDESSANAAALLDTLRKMKEKIIKEYKIIADDDNDDDDNDDDVNNDEVNNNNDDDDDDENNNNNNNKNNDDDDDDDDDDDKKAKNALRNKADDDKKAIKALRNKAARIRKIKRKRFV